MNAQFKRQSKCSIRVSQEKKSKLLELVFKESMRIKDASQLLGLIYSTAKNIIQRYKKKVYLNIKKLTCLNNIKRCQIRQIKPTDKPINVIITKIGKREWIVNGKCSLKK